MTEEVKQDVQGQSDQAGTGHDPAQTDNPTSRTFTQADIDRIVKERLERQRQQFADYDDLRQKAAKLDELEDAQKSELEKLQERLAQEQKAREQLAAQHKEALVRMTVERLAAAQGFLDPSDAYRMLDVQSLSVNDAGEVEGAAEALKQLAEQKPYLLRPQGQIGATNPARGGGQTGETDAERRARLLGGGGANPFVGEGGGVILPNI